MYNWNVDEEILKKNPEHHAVWRLEQLINFGLGGEKLKEKDLRHYWSEIKIDKNRRSFLEILLHDPENSR